MWGEVDQLAAFFFMGGTLRPSENCICAVGLHGRSHIDIRATGGGAVPGGAAQAAAPAAEGGRGLPVRRLPGARLPRSSQDDPFAWGLETLLFPSPTRFFETFWKFFICHFIANLIFFSHEAFLFPE